MKRQGKELEEWTDTLVHAFNFTTGVKDKWDTGTIEDKRNILLVVGNSLVLENKKLRIKARSPFQYIVSNVSNQLSKAKQPQKDFVCSVLGE